MKKSLSILLCAALLATASGCASGAGDLTADSKSATDITAEANAAVYDLLDFDDDQEMEFAEKGLIAAPESLEITDEDGKVITLAPGNTYVQIVPTNFKVTRG